jgi:hypothetical protein
VLPALLDQFAHINVCIAAHHDIVTTRTQRVTGFDSDEAFTRIAHDLQTTHYAPTMQVTVVQFVFVDDVPFQTVKVVFSE